MEETIKCGKCGKERILNYDKHEVVISETRCCERVKRINGKKVLDYALEQLTREGLNEFVSKNKRST